MPFWSENGYTLSPCWFGIGYGFRGNYGSVWTYSSFLFQMSTRKKEKYADSKWIWRVFCLPSYLSNDNIISAKRPGLKRGMDFRGLVWKRVWKIVKDYIFLVWNRVRIWRTGRHTLTKNFQDNPSPPGVPVLERFPSYRKSNKGSKQRQGPTPGVRFIEVSLTERVYCNSNHFLNS